MRLFVARNIDVRLADQHTAPAAQLRDVCCHLIRTRFWVLLIVPAAILLVLDFGGIAVGYTQSNRPGASSSGDPKTIIDLQPFSQARSIVIKDATGKEGLATLIQLNPYINDWSVLRITWRGGSPAEEYHLENNSPGTQRLLLEGRYASGLIIEEGGKLSVCELWGTGSNESLKAARGISLSLCSSL